MNKIYFFLILNFQFLILNSFCQPNIQWEKCLGGTNDDAAYSILQTYDGGYIVGGSTLSPDGNVTNYHGNEDSWVVKLDYLGNIQWENAYGGTNADDAGCIIQTIDSGYAFIGYTSSNDDEVSGFHGEADYWVVKLDKTDTIQYQKCLGGTGADYGKTIFQTFDGGFICSGTSNSTDDDVVGNHGDYDFWVVKLTDSLTIEWSHDYGGSGSDGFYGNSMVQTRDSGFIFACASNSTDGDVTGNHGGNDYWVVKLNDTGAIQWEKSFGGFGDDDPASIIQTLDGGYIVAGYSYSNDGDVSGNIGSPAYWILKLTDSGAIQWQKCLGGSGDNEACSIIQKQDGSYVVGGFTNSNDGDVTGNHGGDDYWIVKLDTSGNIVWKQCYGGTGNDLGISICKTNDGGYALAGITVSDNGDVSGYHGGVGGDFWIVKLAPDTATGINEIKAQSYFADLYPNPSDGNFNLYYNLPGGQGVLIITDLNGRIIYTCNVLGISGIKEINVTNFENGVYYWKIETDNKSTPYGKIVIMK